MKQLTNSEIMNVNGGEINLDVNELVNQINPCKWFYDFGHDVIYPYVYKPLFK